MPIRRPFSTALALALAAAAPAARADVVTVTSVADTASPLDGVCTLREAILAANLDVASGTAPGECSAGSGADVVAFAIPGPGPHTINLLSGLPLVTSPVAIDGTTQAGTVCGEQLMIEIAGSTITANHQPDSGIHVAASGAGSSIRGLAFYQFTHFTGGRAVVIGASDVIVQCNGFGFDGDGGTAIGNRIGIDVAAAEPGVTGLVIGTDGDGIADAAEANHFGGIEGQGIWLSETVGARIAGNRFGVGPFGDLHPLLGGIYAASFYSPDGLVGSNFDGVSDEIEANHFAGCEFGGVSITGGAATVAIRGNRMEENAGGGIAGPLLVDDDPDLDGFQNRPDLVAVTYDATNGRVRATVSVSSAPEDVPYPILVDLYRSDLDGQDGERYLGTVTYSGQDFAAGTFTAVFASAAVLDPGDLVVATATNAAGDTSRFSPSVTPDFAAVPEPPTRPTSIFSDGFETGSLGAWSGGAGI